MGAGKSTVLAQIQKQGTTIVSEPARQILKEQRAIDGTGVYDKDDKLFCELMLSRAIGLYNMHTSEKSPVIFDRGIGDHIAYFQLFNYNFEHAKKAAETYRYNPTIFVLPGWEEIYQTDDERTMSFEQANDFGVRVVEIYQELGYKTVEVPKVSAKERAEFILGNI